ncbi:hypothetical protein GCM10010911_41160 [Paenibacillus nasutitermitis]|uniref:Uncharacterized protein n=1 Tax=Paenibacillus nasutitermitis TaxID=1652958 RepID=A0A916Z7F6_9BACL|nr:hypothetical protein GCM10010911_41160 [Paenibacillus nasutitermitis]
MIENKKGETRLGFAVLLKFFQNEARFYFRSNNDVHRPVILALELIKKYNQTGMHYFPLTDEIPINGVIRNNYKEIIIEKDEKGQERVNRINYEISVLQMLRDKLRCKEIWASGANRYRNPDEDLPVEGSHFQRATYGGAWYHLGHRVLRQT